MAAKDEIERLTSLCELQTQMLSELRSLVLRIPGVDLGAGPNG